MLASKGTRWVLGEHVDTVLAAAPTLQTAVAALNVLTNLLLGVEAGRDPAIFYSVLVLRAVNLT